MKNKSGKQVYAGLLLIIILLSFTSVSLPVHANDPPPPTTNTYRDVDLMVPLPVFEDNQQKEKQSVKSDFGGYFVNYISLIMTWLTGILGMVCVGIFIFSGFQIMANFGNTEAVTQAKDRILSTVFGLILLITGALLLHTINPGFFRWDASDNPSSEQMQIVISSPVHDSKCDKKSIVDAKATALVEINTLRETQQSKYSIDNGYVGWNCMPSTPSPKVERYGADICKVYYAQVCRFYTKG